MELLTRDQVEEILSKEPVIKSVDPIVRAQYLATCKELGIVPDQPKNMMFLRVA